MSHVVRFPYSILHFSALEDSSLNDGARALPTDSWGANHHQVLLRLGREQCLGFGVGVTLKSDDVLCSTIWDRQAGLESMTAQEARRGEE